MAAQSPPSGGTPEETAPRQKRDRTHYLYIAVIVAVLAGIAVGFAAPGFAVGLKPLGTGFVNLINMMIGIVGMMHAAGDWWLRERPCSRAQLVQHLADLLWGRLAAAGDRLGGPGF